MLRITLILFLSLSTFFAFSQVNIINHSLTDTSQNIFYVGVDNLIKISGKQYDYRKQSVSIKGGGAELIPRGIGIFIVKVQTETDVCRMWINENGKSIFKKDFICRKVGDIVHNYGGSIDSVATIDQLLANPFLYIGIPGSYYKQTFSITSFSAIFMNKDSDSTTSATGNLITAKQKELIKKLLPGDLIVFERIYCIGPDSRRRLLTPIIIYIK